MRFLPAIQIQSASFFPTIEEESVVIDYSQLKSAVEDAKVRYGSESISHYLDEDSSSIICSLFYISPAECLLL